MTAEQDLTQLVLTLPGSDGIRIARDYVARTTLGVLTTLIAQADHRLVLAAPFMQPGQGLNQEPLAGALMTALRKLIAVDIASTGPGLDSLDRDRLRWIAKGRLRFFQPTANWEDSARLGLHAKFCVADGQRAYIGSANLTRPGLQEHLEMGVLVRGRIAAQVDALWRHLIEREYFVEA